MKSWIETADCALGDTLCCRGTPVLRYGIHYPQFRSRYFREVLCFINQYYRLEALRQEIHCRKVLFAQAVRQCRDAAAGEGRPAAPYEVDARFRVTYGGRCALSLYSDVYTFTGGAHGNTTRFSQTWDLCTGEISPMRAFLTAEEGDGFVLEEVLRQIRRQVGAGNEPDYFDGEEENVAQGFDPAQFYLTPTGMTVYFQQYALAPYSSGIREFQLPFSAWVREPACREG